MTEAWIARRLSVLALALALALPSAAALAADGTCAVKASVFAARRGMERMGAELRRQAELRILAIGSSSTAGYGATTPDRAYPAKLQAALAGLTGRSDIRVENAGVSGEAAEATLQRLESRITTGEFDVVIWQVGTNDAVRGADEAAFRAYLERGIQAARRSGVDLVLLDQQFFPAIKDPVRYERFVGMLAEAARSYGVPLFSRYALMKAWGERSGDELRAMLGADGFHMSDRGYGCIAELLADDLLRAASPAMARGKATVAIAN
jgi:lysophospholipase L1-like esterase